MQYICNTAMRTACKTVRFGQQYIMPVNILLLRVLLGFIFLKAGLLKIEDMGNTIFLFELEYNFPIINHVLAAYLATFTEIVGGALLIIGLGTRFAAVPIFVMAATIQFVLGMQNPAYFLYEHYFWIFSAVYFIFQGGGMLSIDTLFCKYCCKSSCKSSCQDK